MFLDPYMKMYAISNEVLAEKLGVSPVTVHRYRKKKRVPEPEIMQRIYEITGGKVTPNDFHHLPQLNKN